jgi:hypothetical protein
LDKIYFLRLHSPPLAWFFEFINNWFDVTSDLFRPQALHATAGSKIAILQQMLDLAPKLCLSRGSRIANDWKPIQTGILMATKSIIDFHANLVLTGQVNAGRSGKSFSQICGRGDSYPSPVEFRQNLRLVSVAQFVKTLSHSSYASDDSLQFAVPFLKPSKDVTGNDECLPSEVNEDVNEKVKQA